MIPYGRQWIDEDDIRAVVEVLRSDWLTTGPCVESFEMVFAEQVGSKYAVAVSSGTAALHAAMFALGIGPGDEVIVPAMTFAASANCIVFQGGTPVFADVEPGTLLIDPCDVEKKITSKTKAVIAVDYAGQPCDYETLETITDRACIVLVDDACHALGARYRNTPVGSLAELSAFSFHPVKHITTGEGGMITTDDEDLVRRMRIFRNHGITTDHHQRESQGSWFYEMVDLGYNYRLTDFQCALGMSQLKKLSEWIRHRQSIAGMYDEAFKEMQSVQPLQLKKDVLHAYHLYVVRINSVNLPHDRSTIFGRLRNMGIGVNVHYVPVHLHPFYRNRFHAMPGMCPVAEKAYEEIISLPLFPGMSDTDAATVIEAFEKALK
jgi:perosamine synthetase